MTAPKLAIHAGSLPAAPTIVPVCQIGPHSHRQSGRAPSDPSVCANTYHRPPSQSDRVDRSRPTSFRPTPRPIPHSAGCTLRALPTAISCLGAFRTPAAGARGWHRGCRHPKTCTMADVTHMRGLLKPPVDEAEAATPLSLIGRILRRGPCDAEIGNQKPPPIRELAFASLKAPLRPARASVDPMDAREEREASGRRRIAPYGSRKTTVRPARNS